MAALSELEQVITRSPKLRPRTKHLYLLGVRAFIDFAGEVPTAWTPRAVERWSHAMLADGAKPQTVNVNLHALRYAARKYADRNNKPELDFAADIVALSTTPPKVRKGLKPEQRQALLEACEGDKPIDLRDRALCTLGLRAGLRRTTMCSVQLEDFRDNQITLTLKGERRHTITLDSESMAALQSWVDYLKQNGVTKGPIFRALSKPHRNGSVTIREHMSPDGLFRALKSRASAAGIKRFYPHIFYHTFLMWAKEQGWDDSKISEVTGKRRR